MFDRRILLTTAAGLFGLGAFRWLRATPAEAGEKTAEKFESGTCMMPCGSLRVSRTCPLSSSRYARREVVPQSRTMSEGMAVMAVECRIRPSSASCEQGSLGDIRFSYPL